MIDLVVVETDKLPANALEWHEQEISFNTIFLTIWGPNPVTGVFTGKLMHVAPATNVWGNPVAGGIGYYRTSNGEIFSTTDSGKAPRKYRNSIINLPFVTNILRYDYIPEGKTRTPYTSLDQIKEHMLSEQEIKAIRKSIAGLYPSPVVSYRGTL